MDAYFLGLWKVTTGCFFSAAVDHLPDKETRKRKPKKTFEIDFGDDVNFDTFFRTTRVKKKLALTIVFKLMYTILLHSVMPVEIITGVDNYNYNVVPVH